MGGGVKKKRKTMGKINCFRVCPLKSMSINPEVKIGRVIVWYSIGVKVYDPNQ